MSELPAIRSAVWEPMNVSAWILIPVLWIATAARIGSVDPITTVIGILLSGTLTVLWLPFAVNARNTVTIDQTGIRGPHWARVLPFDEVASWSIGPAPFFAASAALNLSPKRSRYLRITPHHPGQQTSAQFVSTPLSFWAISRDFRQGRQLMIKLDPAMVPAIDAALTTHCGQSAEVGHLPKS